MNLSEEEYESELNEFLPPQENASAYDLWKIHLEKRTLRQEYLEKWNQTVAATGTGRPIDAIIAPVSANASAPHGFNRYVWLHVTVRIMYELLTHTHLDPQHIHLSGTPLTIRHVPSLSPRLFQVSMGRSHLTRSLGTVTRRTMSNVRATLTQNLTNTASDQSYRRAIEICECPSGIAVGGTPGGRRGCHCDD